MRRNADHHPNLPLVQFRKVKTAHVPLRHVPSYISMDRPTPRHHAAGSGNKGTFSASATALLH